MSQEKVQRYKEEKANRKDTVKKEKRVKLLTNIVLIAVPVVLVLLLVDSGVRTYLDSRPRESVSVDYTDLSDYIETLTAEEEEKKEDSKDDKQEESKDDKKEETK